MNSPLTTGSTEAQPSIEFDPNPDAKQRMKHAQRGKSILESLISSPPSNPKQNLHEQPGTRELQFSHSQLSLTRPPQRAVIVPAPPAAAATAAAELAEIQCQFDEMDLKLHAAFESALKAKEDSAVEANSQNQETVALHKPPKCRSFLARKQNRHAHGKAQAQQKHCGDNKPFLRARQLDSEATSTSVSGSRAHGKVRAQLAQLRARLIRSERVVHQHRAKLTLLGVGLFDKEITDIRQGLAVCEGSLELLSPQPNTLHVTMGCLTRGVVRVEKLAASITENSDNCCVIDSASSPVLLQSKITFSPASPELSLTSDRTPSLPELVNDPPSVMSEILLRAELSLNQFVWPMQARGEQAN